MKYTMGILVGCVTLIGAFPTTSAGDQAADEAAVRATGDAYVKEFNAHNATALAKLWSPEAVYTNRATGEQVTGRDAIARQFVALFKDKETLKLAVNVESIQFMSPNTAVEHGTAQIITTGAEPETVDYSAVYVRRDGNWLLDNVTDKAPRAGTASHYEHLKELEWIIGSWLDEDEDASIVTECNWTRNNNFITRSFKVNIEDRVDMAGMQIIGWDPAAKTIRSWTFDSDGSFSAGVWKKKGDRWSIHKKGTLADGRKVTAVNILKYVDNDTCTMQSVQRAVDGELLPNVDEVRVVRR